MTQSAFPTVRWGETQATFHPPGEPLPAGAAPSAALVFAFLNTRFIVADIAGRGWCIPGGRLEPGETPEEAVRREALEEAGITLGPLQLIGHYLLQKIGAGVQSLVPVYVASVSAQEALPPGTESRGVRLLTLAEIPAHYYMWDPLIAAVFHHAWNYLPEESFQQS